ncbi:zinc finger MYM-type protein 1-like [Aphis craccivora]|uniref:Zinc finger MYM-type protein 1-like n=1 Tax=Aphis craccivora TaxID=307492 RepID=A0A6G0XRG3_APHCR|nr:zinc finger MYM-type protein 1-like [Aphis craccivora]
MGYEISSSIAHYQIRVRICNNNYKDAWLHPKGYDSMQTRDAPQYIREPEDQQQQMYQSYQHQRHSATHFIRKPEKRLLEVRDIVDKTGKGMANKILETLRINNLDLQNLVFQSYDFVNNMSGQFNGAQQKITGATWTTKRYGPLLNKLNEIESSLKLRNLSQTRWTARAGALKLLWKSYPIIIDALDNIVEEKKIDKKN